MNDNGIFVLHLIDVLETEQSYWHCLYQFFCLRVVELESGNIGFLLLFVCLDVFNLWLYYDFKDMKNIPSPILDIVIYNSE